MGMPPQEDGMNDKHSEWSRKISSGCSAAISAVQCSCCKRMASQQNGQEAPQSSVAYIFDLIMLLARTICPAKAWLAGMHNYGAYAQSMLIAFPPYIAQLHTSD